MILEKRPIGLFSILSTLPIIFLGKHLMERLLKICLYILNMLNAYADTNHV